MSACQKKWWAPFQLGCETAEVVYMCSSLLQLVPGSRDLSQTEENNCSSPARTAKGGFRSEDTGEFLLPT